MRLLKTSNLNVSNVYTLVRNKLTVCSPHSHIFYFDNYYNKPYIKSLNNCNKKILQNYIEI